MLKFTPKIIKRVVLYIEREVMIMGNIMKINLYADLKRKKNRKLKLKTVERNIVKYNKWLKKNNMEDKVETYEEFLQVK